MVRKGQKFTREGTSRLNNKTLDKGIFQSQTYVVKKIDKKSTSGRLNTR